tara:strand:- start:77 stop:331 length:255 start_codon:yes stop_codon:yes gene_type:complete
MNYNRTKFLHNLNKTKRIKSFNRNNDEKKHCYTGDKNFVLGYKKAVLSNVLIMSINLSYEIFKYKNYDNILYIENGKIFKKEIL